MVRLHWRMLGGGPVLQGFYDFFHAHKARTFDQHAGTVRESLRYRARQSGCIGAVLRLATGLAKGLYGGLA